MIGPMELHVLKSPKKAPDSPEYYAGITKKDIGNMSNLELANLAEAGDWGGRHFPQTLKILIVEAQDERDMYCSSPFLNPADLPRLCGRKASANAYKARFSLDGGITTMTCWVCSGRYGPDGLSIVYDRYTDYTKLICDHCSEITPSKKIDPDERLDINCDYCDTRITTDKGWFNKDSTDLCKMCYIREIFFSCPPKKYQGLELLVMSNMRGYNPYVLSILEARNDTTVRDYTKITNVDQLGEKYQHSSRVWFAVCDDCRCRLSPQQKKWWHTMGSQEDYCSDCVDKCSDAVLITCQEDLEDDYMMYINLRCASPRLKASETYLEDLEMSYDEFMDDQNERMGVCTD